MGRPPYQVALRLYAIAAERWPEVDAAYASVDLIRFPPHRFLNCVYAWCLDRIAPDKLEEWIHMLYQPLPGAKPAQVTEAQAEVEGQSFMNFMAAHAANTAR